MPSSHRRLNVGLLLSLLLAGVFPLPNVLAQEPGRDTTPPTSTSINVSPDPASTNPTLTATVKDTESAIQSVEFFVDEDPGVGLGTPMSAVDGAFDELCEDVTAEIDISGLASRPHSAFVRATDAAGNTQTDLAFFDFEVQQEGEKPKKPKKMDICHKTDNTPGQEEESIKANGIPLDFFFTSYSSRGCIA